ncbi:MAG: nitrous oxide reductase accessory protein NosL [Bacteroidia bacterium]
MKSLQPISRVLIAVATLALIPTFFLPIWRIELTAPQYPEGLSMNIWLNKLSGDIDIINGLNHYIGMAKISVESFPEFQYLPIIVGFFIIIGIVVALWNRLLGVIAYLGLLMVAGIAALWDFYRWGYEYGHNLSPDAAIQVPGMAYQPPIIGYKQLLNFGAYSIPDSGGWCVIFTGVLVALVWVYEQFYLPRKMKVSQKTTIILTLLGISALFSACSVQPEPIRFGKDNCHVCKMTLADTKFGMELVTPKGKIYKFDDVSCLLNFLKEGSIPQSEIKQLLVVDYAQTQKLIPVEKAFFLFGENIKSPMRGDIAAFEQKDACAKAKESLNAEQMNWTQVLEKF